MQENKKEILIEDDIENFLHTTIDIITKYIEKQLSNHNCMDKQFLEKLFNIVQSIHNMLYYMIIMENEVKIKNRNFHERNINFGE